MLPGLREDALSAAPDGFELRVGLPWIRSLPLAGISGLSVEIDNQPVADDDLTVVLGDRRVAPAELTNEVGCWWFLQDRLVLRGVVKLTPARHTVAVDFSMVVPYLAAGPNGPLVLPFHLEAELRLDETVFESAARDLGEGMTDE